MNHPSKCPQCGNRTYVMETRTMQTTIRRRRECPDCKTRCTTHEITEDEWRILRMKVANHAKNN